MARKASAAARAIATRFRSSSPRTSKAARRNASPYVYRCTKEIRRKRQPWKIEVADEHDEPIATVLRPGTTAALLVGHLAAFVAQVDVAEPRVPEVAVVPHG